MGEKRSLNVEGARLHGLSPALSRQRRNMQEETVRALPERDKISQITQIATCIIAQREGLTLRAQIGHETP